MIISLTDEELIIKCVRILEDELRIQIFAHSGINYLLR